MAFQVNPFISTGIPSNSKIEIGPFQKIGDGYYYIESNDATNWYEAYEKCRRLDADLITFETVAEWDAIVKYLNDRGDKREYWTSGNDLANKGKHNWFTNAKPIDINKWAGGQPDNDKGREHCIHLGYVYKTSTKYELNDRPCSNQDNNSRFRYICEKPQPISASFILW
ncbi:C-type lectin 37Da [Scaptodrosophila lebanonensis]|uniref:C-type lectin 37Da n=1 Tax=Drosophila lebanonensis TaxID=7225 RepID=A0A6J2TPD6_DROLE|nr:C-type lectin 37Da [Scaptodrosophila lebanonensis]